MDDPEPPKGLSRSALLMVILTSVALLAGVGIMAALFLAERRKAPEPAADTTIGLPPSFRPRPPLDVPPMPKPVPHGQGPAARPVPPEEAALPPETRTLLDRINWDALGSMMLRYTLGPEPPKGAALPPLAAQILADGFVNLDAIAREMKLPDAQAAMYEPAVRTRLVLAWLGAAGVTLSPEQEDVIRRFHRDEYGEAWRKALGEKDLAPLARGRKILDSQERFEGLLKTLLSPEQDKAYLGALGADPLRNERIPVEGIPAAGADRAQALAERWDKVFDHAVPSEQLRGRAADMVWQMDQARARFEALDGKPLPPDSERSLQRKLLSLQVEAEAALAPRPGMGSARALRFLP